MNRTIKFRAWIIQGVTAKYIYSDEPDISFCFEGDEIFIVDSYGDRHDLERDDIAQLIATDINGNEIYEGDFCICKGAVINPFQATFDHFTAIRDGLIFLKEAHSCEE